VTSSERDLLQEIFEKESVKLTSLPAWAYSYLGNFLKKGLIEGEIRLTKKGEEELLKELEKVMEQKSHFESLIKNLGEKDVRISHYSSLQDFVEGHLNLPNGESVYFQGSLRGDGSFYFPVLGTVTLSIETCRFLRDLILRKLEDLGEVYGI